MSARALPRPTPSAYEGRAATPAWAGAKDSDRLVYARVVKRALDLLFAVAIMPLLLPVIALCALAVKLDSRGPAFYIAPRAGRGGRPFNMYKLRTMLVDAPNLRMPDGSAYSAHDDPRVTRVGRLLRRTSLDELPQVFNVLKGEMSFIGPRPDDLEEASLYQPGEERKLEQRPGISGYAQVYGRNAIEWRDRLALDAEYIERISFALDVKIFFRTFAVVFGRQGLYADESGPKPTGEETVVGAAGRAVEPGADGAADDSGAAAAAASDDTFAADDAATPDDFATPGEVATPDDGGAAAAAASDDTFAADEAAAPDDSATSGEADARDEGGAAAAAAPAAFVFTPPHPDRVRLVSLVVVAKGESAYLPLLLADIVAQDFPHGAIEVLLVDSDAGADLVQRQLMEGFAGRAASEHGFRRAVVLDNPKVNLPAGCNVALKAYQGDVFIRIDAHARIPSSFVRRCVEVLEEGHDACGGPRPVVLSRPSPWARTLLAAETSRFGAGAAAYRRISAPGPVASVFHGAYRRRLLERVGYYNERLRRTEDNDYSRRIRQAGFTIWADPRIRSEQYLRPSLPSLTRQKAANGYWIGRTIWISPSAVSLMHLVPMLFVLAIMAGVLLGAFAGRLPWPALQEAIAASPWLAWLPLLVLADVYAFAAVGASMLAAIRSPGARALSPALPVVFLLLHLSYGLGSLGGLLYGYCAELVDTFRRPAKAGSQATPAGVAETAAADTAGTSSEDS